MDIAALIVAAGFSAGEDEFKPMRSIGSISAAQRVIATLSQAGCRRIVMVTGYNATMLERHLSGAGIIFLRNEHYGTTQMFDSVKIGLAYLRDKCDRLLFTPVDIPLFTAKTVKTILKADALLACPRCKGIQGHPVLIANELIPELLADQGGRGLEGALERCSVPLKCIEVDDPGTIYDMDASACSGLMDLHNSQLVRPVLSVSLAREKSFFNSKIAMLLMLIDETKSVRAAGQRMQLSYSSCWNIIRTLESQLEYPLIERSQGGAGGSSSILTLRGREFLDRYTAYEKALKEEADAMFDRYFGGMFE
ncbi:MAG: NTP transferase domain-containing protein [Bacillota bacterium]|nr:NTP transferase domain-containing protein [Bacillota bacterium]